MWRLIEVIRRKYWKIVAKSSRNYSFSSDFTVKTQTIIFFLYFHYVFHITSLFSKPQP